MSADDLHKTYRLGRVDVPVLKGTTLDVGDGEWLAILGASGTGKSTLLHLLGDLDQPDTGCGAVSFEGRPLSALSRHDRNHYRNRSIGFVFQFYHLLPELNVLENTLLPALVGLPGGPTTAGSGRCAGRPRRCWNRLAWAIASSTGPVSFPAGSASGWPSPGRS
jgi:ABC-type lipoprotein export system ATPase subunit